MVNVFVLTYFQNDYYLKFERHTDFYYNKDYFGSGNYSYHFVNRTTKAISFYFTLIKKVGNNMKFTLQTYKFASNDYRLFPLYYEENPCIALSLDIFGTSMKHYDTNVKSCPLEKGYYYLRNARMRQSGFPPHVPRGRYMFDVQLYDENVLLTKAKIYIKVVPTNALEVERF
ncbi:hypothetical protein RN001_010666 [Aquatica leii]|uniref:Uncharacterized protein n=1 Tax=Aquatica leii TaxID=1421715 RepID=A0AAN7SQF4_9COLE|nr:hypothetical protein RN001_010666 [Aquatica leii]